MRRGITIIQKRKMIIVVVITILIISGAFFYYSLFNKERDISELIVGEWIDNTGLKVSLMKI